VGTDREASFVSFARFAGFVNNRLIRAAQTRPGESNPTTAVRLF
jgi:hypothetical protein